MKNKIQKQFLTLNLIVGISAGLLAGIAVSYALILNQHRENEYKKELLITEMDGMDDCGEWVSKQLKRFDSYILTEEEQSNYDTLLAAGKTLPADDYGNQTAFVLAAKNFEAGVKTRLDADAEDRMEQLKGQSPGYASDKEKQQLDAYAGQMEQLIADGRYKDLDALADEWTAYAQEASQKKTGYQVTVTQYDLSRYPTVRMYLDVRDQATGALVEQLSPNMFYVSEQAAGSGDFLNRAVTKAVQMNENERLNLNLLADTSGSMSDYNKLDSAKSIMKNFIGTVQFSAGDQVKMTEFNSYIDKSGFFTGDRGTLTNIINNYSTSGQTKLYDAIIYGVQDASGQQGAKCVIAFTDGMDVGSYNTAQDVINLVSRYNIPVFIVRIGDSTNAGEDNSLRQIAAASGGAFKNLSEFSSDMTSFYNQIYRQMKQYYVVEFEAMSDEAGDMTQEQSYNVYVQNQELGGENLIRVKPAEEVFDTLLGAYLRSYIIDMNNHSYDRLAQYVDSTTDSNDKWSIQWQMKKQVTGGFSNVTEESLMDYSVQQITVQDSNTVLLKAVENYDVIYDEVYGDLKKSERTVAQDALEYLKKNYGYTDLDDAARIRIWAKVNQIPQYIVKKGADGEWKFSSYAGDLALGERRKVYDVEVTYNPSSYGW